MANFFYFIKKIIRAILPHRIIAFRRKLYLEKQIKQRLTKKKKLSFEIYLVDHCNLNCQCCGVFAPIADKKFYNVEKLENDFKRMHELADGKINRISLLGGEPLLHPDLLKILDIAGKYFNKIDTNIVEIVTNAILLEKQSHEFWVSCKKNNIRITITKYPINLPFKKIERKGKEYDVIIKYNDNSKYTLKTFIKHTMNIAGSAEPIKSFRLCYKANNCTVLDDGKIYPCSATSRIKYFNKHFKVDLKACDKDCIDIYESNLDEILEFLCKPVPFCRYCDTDKWVFDLDWAVSKKNISEWV
ncbi:MAG: radical SAM protein [Fibromonadaceae bacterium]|jgi:MoaA/NifB/PqqE/SkfB family radical SAM enzyme|nr:radical SAM protein [Fibromonadaceae bacterium]